jgi:hypothetical protein
MAHDGVVVNDDDFEWVCQGDVVLKEARSKGKPSEL